MGGHYQINWEKIANLIEAATGDEEDKVFFRKKLQYGTPEEKMRVLAEYGFDFEELVRIHAELEKVFYKGSLPWWFW
jgi:hypothetical protein